VTLGDPRGIGPEVALDAVRRFREARGDAEVVWIAHEDWRDADAIPGVEVHAVAPWDGSDHDAGRVSGASLEAAVALATAGHVRGVVTGPVHKPSLHEAGWDTPGQTELLRDLSGAASAGMLMCAERTRLGGALRVLLATTHIALRDVPHRVSSSLLEEQCRLLHAALRHDWGIERPRIALCALNPHASDGGLFGDEEARVYAPAVERLGGDGLAVRGPIPADTVFSRALAGEFDAVVAPYHDVGMAAFKTVSFGTGVNVTIGLPFVRTSPDHGTAFDIAGQGTADPSSMLEAIRLADRLAGARFDTSGRGA
jgi:4-hydroxythreonine-4-phosphate dehydrogenase